MCEAWLADRWTVLVATRVLPSARKALLVFGFGSKRGELDDETRMRMRWPLLKISDVLHRSTGNSYTWPGSRKSSRANDFRYRARKMPSVTSIERPSG